MNEYEEPKSNPAEAEQEAEVLSRRDFLHGKNRWSKAVIAAVAGSIFLPREASAWVNTRGSWVNGRGPGGWANRGASWMNGGGGWINAGANWINRGGTWINGGRGWVNGGGGGWLNSRGGGGSAWVNRRGW